MEKDKESPLDMEVDDLGSVSEETRGFHLGHSWDGGLGVKPP